MRPTQDHTLRHLTRAAQRTAEDQAAYQRALERVGASKLEVLGAQVEQDDQDGYLELIRAQVPRPTPQQVADYAEFVSRCHSWYKHLRFTPKHPFQFFLTPVPDAYDSRGFHYAAHPPSFHVREFGHFEYRERRDADDATPVSVSAGDRQLRVPPSLLRAGTGWANAMLHPRFLPRMPRDAHEHFGIDAYERELLAREAPGLLTRVWALLAGPAPASPHEIWASHAQEQRADALVSMTEAMHAVLDLVYGPAPSRERPSGRVPWLDDRTRPRPYPPDA